MFKKSSIIVALFLALGCMLLEASARERLLQETEQSIFTQSSPEEVLYSRISRWCNVTDDPLFNCFCEYIAQDCVKGHLNAQKNVLGHTVSLESQLKSLEKSSPERARRIMRAIAVQQIKLRCLNILDDTVVYQGTEALYVQWYNQTNYLDTSDEGFYSDGPSQSTRFPLSFTKKGLQSFLFGTLGLAALAIVTAMCIKLVRSDKRQVVVRH